LALSSLAPKAEADASKNNAIRLATNVFGCIVTFLRLSFEFRSRSRLHAPALLQAWRICWLCATRCSTRAPGGAGSSSSVVTARVPRNIAHANGQPRRRIMPLSKLTVGDLRADSWVSRLTSFAASAMRSSKRFAEIFPRDGRLRSDAYCFVSKWRQSTK
jgi:hypothetical protein